MSTKLRVAWFADSGGLSLSSYTTALLAPKLLRELDVQRYTLSEDPAETSNSRHALSAWDDHRRNPYDICFYQIEDSRDLGPYRILPGLVPGIVLFHDLVFSSYGPEPILNSAWKETIRKFNDPKHPWPSYQAKHDPEGPLGHREAGLSFVPVFSQVKHSTDYENQIKLSLRTPGAVAPAPALYLPIPVDPLPLSSGSAKTICFAGTPRIEHRAHMLLRAISALDNNTKLHWMLDESEVAQAQDLLVEFGIKNFEITVGRSAQAWKRILADSGIAVHLHFSVFGNLSPYLEMSLMAGLPTLVTNFGIGATFPDSVVFKIDAGESEAQQIAETFSKLQLLGEKFKRQAIQSYAIETFATDGVAHDLLTLFRRATPYLAQQMKRWENFEAQAKAELVGYAKNLVEQRCGEDKIPGAGGYWSNRIAPIFGELGWR